MVRDDREYMRSLKKDDSYHFSIPFEYITKHLGGDDVETAIANMEVDATWDDGALGYVITHYVPDMALIDPAEGNGDEEEFYRGIVYFEVMDKLASLGIGSEAVEL